MNKVLRILEKIDYFFNHFVSTLIGSPSGIHLSFKVFIFSNFVVISYGKVFLVLFGGKSALSVFSL